MDQRRWDRRRAVRHPAVVDGAAIVRTGAAGPRRRHRRAARHRGTDRRQGAVGAAGLSPGRGRGVAEDRVHRQQRRQRLDHDDRRACARRPSPPLPAVSDARGVRREHPLGEGRDARPRGGRRVLRPAPRERHRVSSHQRSTRSFVRCSATCSHHRRREADAASGHRGASSGGENGSPPKRSSVAKCSTGSGSASSIWCSGTPRKIVATSA